MKKAMDPRMHSAEHLLNQTMQRLYKCNRCFSAHIEKKKSKCDYHFDHALNKQEIARIEKMVNEVIKEDLPVSEEFLTREEAQKAFSLDRLPGNVKEMVRIVRIGEYDACPCIGPHVKSTKQIGEFRIVSTTFEKGVLRIRYKLDRPKEDRA